MGGTVMLLFYIWYITYCRDSVVILYISSSEAVTLYVHSPTAGDVRRLCTFSFIDVVFSIHSIRWWHSGKVHWRIHYYVALIVGDLTVELSTLLHWYLCAVVFILVLLVTADDDSGNFGWWYSFYLSGDLFDSTSLLLSSLLYIYFVVLVWIHIWYISWCSVSYTVLFACCSTCNSAYRPCSMFC
jgi:hypothetical protein